MRIDFQMASLNATDANMPVALESFDDCANQSNPEDEENHTTASDDNENASIEDDDHRDENDTLIDSALCGSNDHSNDANKKTIEHISSLKGLIASNEDLSSDSRSQHHESVSSVFSVVAI